VVNRLACRFRIPDALPRRVETVDRLVRAIEVGAPPAAARRLRAALADASGVIRIRTLRLESQIDLGCMDEAAIGERLGGLLAVALARELERTPGANRRHFRNRAAFLAAFVSALQRGEAWQAWWFQEFHELRSLGDIGAAVHALAGTPAHLLAALGDLEAGGELERFLQRLCARDLRRLWDALGLASVPDSLAFDDAAFAGIARAARAAPASVGGRPGQRRARALRLLAIARRGSAGAPSTALLARAARRFADFEAALAEAPELASLIATGAGLYPALRRRLTAAGHAPTVAWLEPLLAAQGGAFARAVADPGPVRRWGRSAVGALALLLPALGATGLWPHLVASAGEAHARELIFLALLKPLGRTRALLEAGDPLLASLAGLRAPPVLDARAPRVVEPDSATWPVPPAEGDPGAFDLGERFGYPWLGPRLDRALSTLALGLIRATAARCPPLERLAPGAFVNLVLAQPATLETVTDHHRVHIQAPLAGVGAGLFPAQTLVLPWLDRPLLLEPAFTGGTP
jgi:hypothetical protein